MLLKQPLLLLVHLQRLSNLRSLTILQLLLRPEHLVLPVARPALFAFLVLLRLLLQQPWLLPPQLHFEYRPMH